MTNLNRRELIGFAGSLLLTGCAMRNGEIGGSDSNPDSLDAARFTAARKYARTPFGDIAYLEKGQGRTVLLLHGFPLNGFQWRGVIERLGPHARCIAPDFLGMGHTRVAREQEVGADSQVLMLASLLNALGAARVDLIANGTGGAVAQLFAVRYPERVRSLLLTNCDTEIQSPPAALQPMIALSHEGRFVDEWLARWHADPALARSARGIGGMCYWNRAHPTDEAIDMYFGPPIESIDSRRALHRFAIAMQPNTLIGIEGALRRGRIPTRVAWGTADKIYDATNADYLDRTFGNSRGVRRLPHAKLFWPEERPDIVAAQARILWASGAAET
jgi:pimeloyl-ACP methyl ester carboxylesterase